MSQSQDIHANGQMTVHELTRLLGLLASTIQGALTARMNFRYLQQQHTKEFRGIDCNQATVFLNSNSKEEFQWWIRNL